MADTIEYHKNCYKDLQEKVNTRLIFNWNMILPSWMVAITKIHKNGYNGHTIQDTYLQEKPNTTMCRSVSSRT